jgi:hypothetical protein
MPQKLSPEGSNSTMSNNTSDLGSDYAEDSHEHGGKNFTLFPAYQSWEQLWTFHS